MTSRRKATPAQAVGINAAPVVIAEWFAGRRTMPITALAVPDWDALPALWADFVARGLGTATPEMLADPLIREHLKLRDPGAAKAVARLVAAARR